MNDGLFNTALCKAVGLSVTAQTGRYPWSHDEEFWRVQELGGSLDLPVASPESGRAVCQTHAGDQQLAQAPHRGWSALSFLPATVPGVGWA